MARLRESVAMFYRRDGDILCQIGGCNVLTIDEKWLQKEFCRVGDGKFFCGCCIVLFNNTVIDGFFYVV